MGNYELIKSFKYLNRVQYKISYKEKKLILVDAKTSEI